MKGRTVPALFILFKPMKDRIHGIYRVRFNQSWENALWFQNAWFLMGDTLEIDEDLVQSEPFYDSELKQIDETLILAYNG